jgi:hypothetical protein
MLLQKGDTYPLGSVEGIASTPNVGQGDHCNPTFLHPRGAHEGKPRLGLHVASQTREYPDPAPPSTLQVRHSPSAEAPV